MKKKFLVIVLFITTLILAACNSNTEKSDGTATNDKTVKIDKTKKHYKEIDFDKWNHDDKDVAYTDKVKIKGKVVQAVDGEKEGEKVLRIALDGDYDKMVYGYIDEGDYKKIVADNDEIVAYGTANGVYTYETVMKSEVTLPYMEIYFYDLNDEIIENESKDFKKEVIFDQDGITFERITNDTFTVRNNSEKELTFTTESIDVNGEVSDSYSFSDLYDDLKPGKFKNVKLTGQDKTIPKNSTLNFTIDVRDQDFNILYTINGSVEIYDDIESNW